jgi:AcrR family transcriptional regulator
MARPRSASFEDHRKEILDCAAALFAQRGYIGTTMNEVADACGVTKPTLYHYYRDKDDLLMSIADGHVSALVDLVAAVEQEHEPGAQRLHALVHGFLQEYAGARDQRRVLTEDVKFLREKDLAQVLDKERRVVAAFADAIAATRPDLQRDQLVKPLAMLLFGMINWLFTWWRPDGTLGPQALATLIDRLLFGGLAAVSASVPAAPSARKASTRRVPEKVGQ